MAFGKLTATFLLRCTVVWLIYGHSFAATITTPAVNDADSIAKTEPALLVISYDSFHAEYFQRNVTPFLNQLSKEATHAEYMQNVFPTKTFVNHFSIATGLFADKHGVLANSLWDSVKGELTYGYDLFHYNESILPIWTINEMSGKHTGCLMWPGSDFAYRNVSCTYTYKYNTTESWTDRMDMALSWFQNKTNPTNLVMAYIEEPDQHGHIFSPDSDVITNMVKKLDDLTKHIQQRLSETGLDKRVNVIYLSDHGMTTVTPKNFIDLTNFIGNNTCKFYGTSPILQVVPNDTQNVSTIYEVLAKAAKVNTHFKVYNHDSILPRWHANNTQRLGPILAVADIGYAFQDMYTTAKWYEKVYNVTLTPTTKYGVHGYDNEEESMHAIFIAKGPLFKSKQILKPFQSINLFNLFCHILKLKCELNDANWDPKLWTNLLIDSEQIEKSEEAPTSDTSGSSFAVGVVVVIGLTVIICGAIGLYVRRKRFQESLANRSYTLSGFDRFDDAAGELNDSLRANKENVETVFNATNGEHLSSPKIHRDVEHNYLSR